MLLLCCSACNAVASTQQHTRQCVLHRPAAAHPGASTFSSTAHPHYAPPMLDWQAFFTAAADNRAFWPHVLHLLCLQWQAPSSIPVSASCIDLPQHILVPRPSQIQHNESGCYLFLSTAKHPHNICDMLLLCYSACNGSGRRPVAYSCQCVLHRSAAAHPGA
jgi:hypothetical protein